MHGRANNEITARTASKAQPVGIASEQIQPMSDFRVNKSSTNVGLFFF